MYLTFYLYIINKNFKCTYLYEQGKSSCFKFMFHYTEFNYPSKSRTSSLLHVTRNYYKNRFHVTNAYQWLFRVKRGLH